jgi:hypothetical protein
MIKETYTKPEAQVEEFSSVDVITTSGIEDLDGGME